MQTHYCVQDIPCGEQVAGDCTKLPLEAVVYLKISYNEDSRGGN